jgi:hypothetical protein
MNPNYFRPRVDLAGNHIRNTSSNLFLLLPKPVQNEDIKPAELRENDLFICYPIVVSFSFSEKLWSKVLFYLFWIQTFY